MNLDIGSERARTSTHAVSQRVHDFADLVLRNRMAQALHDRAATYPVHRELRFAARTSLEALFDTLALTLGWRAQRLGPTRMLLDGEGLFVAAYGTRKADYCSCVLYIWSADVAIAEKARQSLEDAAGATLIREPMFSIDWHFMTSCNELQSVTIEEMADDVLLDEAYPELEDGVASFVARYLASAETILLLQGPPGTGKTRLIRAVLAEISRRKGWQAQALYTGDKKALENDEIFVKFVTGDDDAFVVEDADHLLQARADGNEHLHRFLAIADGVVRAQGRKIVFSTNLPNLGDLDDALVRPGRCFARLFVRELTPAEATVLLQRLGQADEERVTRAAEALAADGRKAYSLAQVYRAHQCAGARSRP